MAKIILTKWGNSMGIRIPASIVKEANLSPGVELKIIINKKGGITLIPVKDLQEGWTEAFNAIADSKHDNLILDDLQNDFDEEEWEW